MIFRPMAASILLTGCGTMGLDLLQQDSGAMDGNSWLVLEPQAGLDFGFVDVQGNSAIETAMLTAKVDKLAKCTNGLLVDSKTAVQSFWKARGYEPKKPEITKQKLGYALDQEEALGAGAADESAVPAHAGASA